MSTNANFHFRGRYPNCEVIYGKVPRLKREKMSDSQRALRIIYGVPSVFQRFKRKVSEGTSIILTIFGHYLNTNLTNNILK
jgi:hypothetical protein